MTAENMQKAMPSMYPSLSDETTKSSHKLQFYGVGIAKPGDDSPKTLYLGVSEVASKSAENSLIALKSKISSLSSDSAFFEKFLGSVNSTQSDRASTQAKFSDLLEEERRRILPSLRPDWEGLADGKKAEALTFHRFFCQLHVVANLSDVVVDALCEHEEVLDERPASSRPAVLVVLKECARFFSERAAGLHGVFSVWKTWAVKKGLSNFALPAFLGHRWNILFLLAARVVLLRHDLLEFIGEYYSQKPELVLISQLLQNDLVVSHLQVLGLIDSSITGPMWRLVEHSGHVLDTCHYVTVMQDWLGRVLSDPTLFLQGPPPLADFDKNASDGLRRPLLKIPSTNFTLEAVSLALTACKKYFSRIFVDFLPNGKYYGRYDLVKETSSAPLSNRSIESAFGFISYLYSVSPNMRLQRMEAITLVKKNHSYEWFTSLPAQERAILLAEARKNIANIREDAKKENAKLADEILRLALAKKASKNSSVVRGMKARSKLTTSILRLGFWSSVEEIDRCLTTKAGTSSKCKISALVNQIRFRQKVVLQPEPRPGLYTLTMKGKQISFDELRSRLIELIDNDRLVSCDFSDGDCEEYIGRNITYYFEDDSGNTNGFEGKVMGIKRRADGEPLVNICYKGESLNYPVSLSEFLLAVENGMVELLP